MPARSPKNSQPHGRPGASRRSGENTSRTPDGGKRRWNADERAQRSPSATGDVGRAADGGRAARRDERFRSETQGNGREDRRTDWYPGPRNGRPDSSSRFRRNDGGGAPRAGRAGDAPRRSFRDADERPRRDDADRPRRLGTDDRRPQRDGGGNDRSRRFEGDDRRPQRFSEDRPRRFGTDDRRPQRDGGERPRRFADDDHRPRRDGREAPRRDTREHEQRRPFGGDAPRRSFRDDAPRHDDRRSGRPDDSRQSNRSGGDRTAGTGYEGGRSAGDRFDNRRPEAKRYEERRPAERRQDDRHPGERRFERPARDGAARRPATSDFAPRRTFHDEGPRRASGPTRTDDRRSGDRRFDDRSAGAGARRGPGRLDRPQAWEAPEDVVLAHLEGQVVTADEMSGSSFADLGLGQQITRALADLGATAPFPIQAATIPAALDGRNVLGRGRTGSGKTIAFGAALVERLMRTWAESGRTGTGRRVGRAPRALILAPTRELALQIDRTVQPIARAVGLFTTQIVGGVPQGRQVGALAKGVDIVIGTPGRMQDLVEQGRLDLSQIEISVLDEADHMADLGFLEPIQRLLRLVPFAGQRLLFSATLDVAVSRLVEEFLPNPAVHEVADAEGSGTADHRVLVIEQGEKLPVLAALIGSTERTLVFARTRAFAEQLADELDAEGVRAESLHGDLNQARRTRNLARFSDGKVSALVATDVAARGIHVDDIELVIHADSAEDYKTYLHRSGRTGRAGASGTVVTLITARRRRRFAELLERAGIDAQFVELEAGDDPVAAIGL